jgi:hypothetical protein
MFKTTFKYRWALLSISLLLTVPQEVFAAKDDVKIVAFVRHTFRGINRNVGPLSLALEKYGIGLKSLPVLSWGESSTPRGQDIARDFGSVGLQKVAEKAVKALGEGKNFNGQWDEFRADLATERTLLTALRLREGLKGTMSVTGCPTKVGERVDVIVSREPTLKCAEEELSPLMHASPDLTIFQQRAEKFLKAVSAAINIKGPMKELPAAVYDSEGKLPKEYEELEKLASAIEMTAELGPPLGELFPGSDAKQGKQVLESALNFLGIRFFTKTPFQVADASSVYQLQYIEERKPGTHTLLLTHDDTLSNFLRALDLINPKSEAGELAIYPLETIVFAFGEKNVSVVRMRIQVRDPDGFIPGPFASTVLWKGSRADWDKKVKDVRDRVASWKVSEKTRACLDNLGKKVCDAPALDIRY